MEVYILDSLIRRTAVIDRFESMIWTERYSSAGDFELVIHSTNESRSQFIPGVRLAINESDRIMTVETVEDTEDSEGRSLLTIKGPSLEDILNDRVARAALDNLTTTPKWIITDTPGNVLNYIFQQICVLGVLDPGDIIPFIMEGTTYPPENIPMPEDIITVTLDPDTVYSVTKQIADVYNLGFRLYRNQDTSTLYYDIYTGNDRTTSQTVLAPVVFAPELDNLSNTSELTSTALYKNVAYVIAPNGVQTVLAENVDSAVAGFDRKVLLVKADDITLEAGPELVAALQQRGKDELAKNRSLTAFDGEIPQNGTYKYNRDYRMGDIVESRNALGYTNQMRVTEQIFVSDAEGERSYPTLSVNLLITPGTWLSWDGQEVWDEADGTWDEQ